MSDDQPKRGAAQSLRRGAARFILATPPLRKVFLRLVFDEDMLVRVLEDPVFLHRVMHVKPVTGRLANVLDNPRVFEHFLDSNRVHDRLLNGEAFQSRLAEEQSLILGLARYNELLPALLDGPESIADALKLPGVVEVAARSPEFLTGLFEHAAMAEFIATDRALVGKLAGNHEFLRELLTHETALTEVAASKVLRGYLARSSTRAEELSQDVEFLRALMKHPAAAATVTADEEILARLITNDRVVRRFAADPIALSAILAQPRSKDAILADQRLIGTVLHDERAVAQLVQDVPLLQKIAGRTEMIDAILSSEPLLKRIIPRGKALAAFAADDAFIAQLADSPAVVDRVLQRKTDARITRKLKGLAEFDEAWGKLVPFAAQRTDLAQRAADARAKITDATEVSSAIIDLLCDGDRIHLPGATMEFPDRRSLWVVLQEILIEEEYYFETRASAPRILDCGSHFGLAIYYFKRLFPEARITAFEPLPRMHAMAQRNVETNAMRGVEVLPYALSDNDGETMFHISETDSMAGSLTERRRTLGDHLVPVAVQCRKLSAWLDEPVHFVKLDIEGSEDVVLEEAASKLPNVQHLFCEYHHGAGLDAARLPKILGILESAGFDVHLGKSYSYQQATHTRSMKHAGNPYSLVIWAKNRNWS